MGHVKLVKKWRHGHGRASNKYSRYQYCGKKRKLLPLVKSINNLGTLLIEDAFQHPARFLK